MIIQFQNLQIAVISYGTRVARGFWLSPSISPFADLETDCRAASLWPAKERPLFRAFNEGEVAPR